jgi:hypothetical protein
MKGLKFAIHGTWMPNQFPVGMAVEVKSDKLGLGKSVSKKSVQIRHIYIWQTP